MQDRTRADGKEQNDIETRIQALEEQVKLGQMERSTFEQLRDQITGGSIGSTHLVKGLDRQLLARVRRGEDVLSREAAETPAGDGLSTNEPAVDVDEEIEAIERKDITPLEKETTAKKGEMAPPPLPMLGQKRSRNDILAELKASRKAAAEAAAAATEPQLGSRFKKVGQKQPASRIERDEQGREILITVDEYGNVKRKYRKGNADVKTALLVPDKAVKPLGMEPPVISAALQPPEDLDEDIFADVGDSYDPLGTLQDEESSDEDEEEIIAAERDSRSTSDALPRVPAERDSARTSSEADIQPQSFSRKSPPAAKTIPSTRHNNYFGSTNKADDSPDAAAPFSDTTMLETLKRAAAIAKAVAPRETNDAVEAPSSAVQRLMARESNDRDYEDMDMGFGSSRFADEEEAEEGGKRIKLSQWKGSADDDDEENGAKPTGGKERKRGGKKKKGDKESAADVLRIIEGRKSRGK